MKQIKISGSIILSIVVLFLLSRCGENKTKTNPVQNTESADTLFAQPDTQLIPKDKFGDEVRYGRSLMLNTAYYIGPNGIAGRYLGNKMNCTNCHQEAGTKPFSFNLMRSHQQYPQYRAREGKVLSLAERVNNCVMRPHSGKPLPLDSKEMLAFLSYFKWLNTQLKDNQAKGLEMPEFKFPDRAADPEKGAVLYITHCSRCHGDKGEGKMDSLNITFKYPPLWGQYGYQPGSSMHRVIKQARWLKANMPQDLATWYKPVLKDEEAFDIAAFVNDDRIHSRPNPKTFDYPFPNEKAIDYGKGPFADSFSEAQHKFGPYLPILDYWKSKGWKPAY
jgi:thiosulfate dehydrogenase